MAQFDQIGPGGVPSFAKQVSADPNQSVLAQVASGQIPMNAILTVGSGAGANVQGGNRPNETVARLLSTGHLTASRPLNSQVSTPTSNGTGTNATTQAVASLAAGVLTVTQITGLATLAVGVQLIGPVGWPTGLTITALGTGTGGLGTYTCVAAGVPAASLNAASATVVASLGAGG